MLQTLILFYLTNWLNGCKSKPDFNFTDVTVYGTCNVKGLVNTIKVKFTALDDAFEEGKANTGFREKKITLKSFHKPKNIEKNSGEISLTGGDITSIFYDEKDNNKSGKVLYKIDGEFMDIEFYIDGKKGNYSFEFQITNSDTLKPNLETMTLFHGDLEDSLEFGYPIYSGLNVIEKGFLFSKLSSNNQEPGQESEITLEFQLSKTEPLNNSGYLPVTLSKFYNIESTVNSSDYWTQTNELIKTVTKKSGGNSSVDIKDGVNMWTVGDGSQIEFRFSSKISEGEIISITFLVINTTTSQTGVFIKDRTKILLSYAGYDNEGFPIGEIRPEYENSQMMVKF